MLLTTTYSTHLIKWLLGFLVLNISREISNVKAEGQLTKDSTRQNVRYRSNIVGYDHQGRDISEVLLSPR